MRRRSRAATPSEIAALKEDFRVSVLAHVINVARLYGKIAVLIEAQERLLKKLARRDGARGRPRR